jgi:hypothetical protein
MLEVFAFRWWRRTGRWGRPERSRRRCRRALRDFRAFNMLEVAIALLLLSGLSALAYGSARVARTEFDHARHRTTLQTLVSTMSRDAAARSSLFNPQLLPRYVEGERFAVTGVTALELSLDLRRPDGADPVDADPVDADPVDADPVDARPVSTEPGSVAAVLSEDLQLLSVAMASTSGRCLRTYSVAGIVAPVSSQRSATCRPLLPDSIRETGG